MLEGWWTGDLVHHRPASAVILQEAGVVYEKYFDKPTFIENTGAIGAELFKQDLNVQVEGYISRAQHRAIMQAFLDGIATSLVYDFQSTDGAKQSIGTSLDEFLRDKTIDIAIWQTERYLNTSVESSDDA